MSVHEIRCCFPEAVESRLCGVGDRRAFAARNIREGDVIIRSLPMAYCVVAERRFELCSFCLSTGQKTGNESKLPQHALLRCSRCREAKYCSRGCQENDHPFHKIECRESNMLLPKCKRGPLDHINAALLVRNFLASRKSSRCQNSDCAGYPGVSCGAIHFESLSKDSRNLSFEDVTEAHRAAEAIWNHRQALRKSLKSFPAQFSHVQQQMEQDLRRFLVNNFGVSDSLLRVCAGAVYPLCSLLNHSCAPNCLLRYSLGHSQCPPIMEVVAACDIDAGKELTHCYLELVSSEKTRQEQLRCAYGFSCQCLRCSHSEAGRFVFGVPRCYMSMEVSHLTEWILRYYNPFDCVDDNFDLLIELNQEILVEPFANSREASMAMDALDHARICLFNGSLSGELKALNRAVRLLESISKSNDPSPLHALSSPDLYKARGDRLSALIVAGDVSEAIKECKQIVAFLCLVLLHVPNHALMGLQLFTLGDLYEKANDKSRARLTYLWANKILRISHGCQSQLCKFLLDKLS